MTRNFPGGFEWGTATAAHQIEGGNWNNDWWQWEHTPGSGCVEPSGDVRRCCPMGYEYWPQALEPARQLRVGVRLPAEVRARGGRPHHVRTQPEAVGGAICRDRRCQRVVTSNRLVAAALSRGRR